MIFGYSNHSQIYPELSRMEQDRLISGHEEIVGSKLTKKKYTITDSGELYLINGCRNR